MKNELHDGVSRSSCEYSASRVYQVPRFTRIGRSTYLSGFASQSAKEWALKSITIKRGPSNKLHKHLGAEWKLKVPANPIGAT